MALPQVQDNDSGSVARGKINTAIGQVDANATSIVSKADTIKSVYDWAIGLFQDILISGTNIKTVNGTTLLGAGDLSVAFSTLGVIYVDTDGDNGTGDVSNPAKPFATIEYVLANVTNTGIITGGTNSNKTIDGISDADNANLVVGQYLSHADLPQDTKIVSKGDEGSDANTITITHTATGTTAATSITWVTPYLIKTTGVITWASNWEKDGFYYDFGISEIFFSGTVFNASTTRVTPVNVIGGYWNGTTTSSVFYNYSFSGASSHDGVFNLKKYNSIGTGVQFDSYSTSSSYPAFNNLTINTELGFYCSFGSIAEISANNAEFNGYKYGLLGGIDLTLNSMIYTSKGRLETPAAIIAIDVATAPTVTATINDNIKGSVIANGTGNYTFNGTVEGATIAAGNNLYPVVSFNGIIKNQSTITITGNAYFKGGWSLPAWNHSTGTLTVESANGTFNTSGGVCIINGVHRIDFPLIINCTGGEVILNGNSRRTTALSSNTNLTIGVNGSVVINGHYAFQPGGNTDGKLTVSSGAVLYYDRSGGSASVVTGVLEIFGTVFLQRSYPTELNINVTPTIKVTTGTIIVNGGKLECLKADSNSGLIMKKGVGGKVILKGQCYLKAINGLAPIQILDNTSTSQDIFDFSMIGNGAVGFRLADTFTDVTYGTAYAPNLLVGGLIQEDITYID